MFRVTMIAAALFVTLIVSPVQAGDNLLINRINASPNGKPSYTTAILTPQIELWVFGVEDVNQGEINVGRTWPLYGGKHASLSLSAYGAYRFDIDKAYIIPWIDASLFDRRAELSVSLAVYLPLNGGSFSLFGNEAFAGYRLTDKVKVGLAGSLWAEEGYQAFRVGPAVKLKVGKGDSVSLRYLFGENGDDTFRLQWNHGF